MKKRFSPSDRKLGLDRDITRRDFVQGTALAAMGLTTPMGWALAGGAPGAPNPVDYPPVRTGLRGSHPETYDVPHALIAGGRGMKPGRTLDETYDLVVVGAGISGLSAALYYQDKFGPDSRILLLENHDDFGGHAKRNEFHQGGEMRIALGGTHNLEYGSYGPVASAMMDRLGIDFERLKEQTGFGYGFRGPGVQATWFDAEHYGSNALLRGLNFRSAPPAQILQHVDAMPLPQASREAMKQFLTRRENLLQGLDASARKQLLRGTFYVDFLREQGGLDQECIDLFRTMTHGPEGFGAQNLSVYEGLDAGLPGGHLLGWEMEDVEFDYPMVMFPDGNASVARLMVRALIPGVCPSANAQNIAVSAFDYAQLDRPGQPARLRLNSTVVRVGNRDGGVAVDYVSGDEVIQVQARHAVLACYHSIIPYLCPEIPDTQKEAMAYQVKCPLLLTNVLLKDGKALKKAGLTSVHCPGRMHAQMYVWQGNTAGGYDQGRWDLDNGPVNVFFWGSLEAPDQATTLKDRLRASRVRMLSLSFEDYEREIRTVLDGVLGPFGLNVADDVLAMTVNRWPHGYAYWYTDLWDPEFQDGDYPHEIARQRFGNITIANADAAADAYTHSAIDEAWRAVSELANP